MKTGYIIAGVSGAGKSTFIHKLIKQLTEAGLNRSDIIVFSLDTCRIAFLFQSQKWDGEWSKTTDYSTEKDTYTAAFEYANSNQKEFDKFVNKFWTDSLTKDVVIVDNTNLTVKSRARWVQDLKSKNFKIVGVQVNVPLQVAIDRQKTRGDKCVPEKVVSDMYMRQQEFFVGTEVDELMNVNGY